MRDISATNKRLVLAGIFQTQVFATQVISKMENLTDMECTNSQMAQVTAALLILPYMTVSVSIKSAMGLDMKAFSLKTSIMVMVSFICKY